MPTVSAPTRVKLQKILFATDFTPSAQLALSYTLNLAHRYDAEVYVVNVLPRVPFVETVPPDPEQIRFLAKQQLTALVGSQSFKGVRHKELIEEGEVEIVLHELVWKHEIDLIVIGTHGHKGLGKVLMGSVAEEVFRNAECPVLTVGPHATRWEIDGKLRHILYATDFGPESVHGLPYAISLAEENRARLTLLHVAPEPGVVLPEPEPGAMPVVDPSEVTASTEKQLRDLVPYGTELWHEPEYMVQFGSPAEMIVAIAAQSVDMIVLGVKRSAAFTKHLGAGIAYQVACEATCPVLSVGARFRV
ncbi:MAG: universal stress protein [Terriglobales bacterium]|jgi:nucleotide-binding universal stress UspA family protein